MSRSHLPYLLGAAVLGALVTFLFLNRKPAPPPEPKVIVGTEAPAPVEIPPPDSPTPPETPETEELAPRDPPAPAVRRDPKALATEVGRALAAGDDDTIARLLGRGALEEETRRQLEQLAAAGIGIAEGTVPVEVGEVELNERIRWAIPLQGAGIGGDRIFLDLVREKDGWRLADLEFPALGQDAVAGGPAADSLGIADAFIQSVLRQDFERAKRFVDITRVSDAKIAGLCILFEEGNYRMREQKPIRSMFRKPEATGFLASVTTPDGASKANFSLLLERGGEGQPWRLVEINLDELLADYTRRVAGGDIYYSPLVKNPRGGDTLVLYFDFDADSLSPRTERQLDIVAELLKTDPEKRLTISGHTDALGTENYNQSLSGRRANAVKAYLAGAGVPESQIVTKAAGQSQPRRPNFTESGEDNPQGRRVNRRTEIYLDF